MEKYYFEALGKVMKEMGSRDFTIPEYLELFKCISDVAYYRHKFNISLLPEEEALARRGLKEADTALNDFIRYASFDDDIKKALITLARDPLSCPRG